MSKQLDRPTPWPAWLGPFCVALAALLAVVSTLGDPGITCDEYYDVQAGKSLVNAFQTQGLDFFRSGNVDSNFGRLTPHPPLGRWLLGWMHHAFDTVPAESYAVAVVAGRFAPALAYGCLVFLTGLATLRVAGTAGAMTAGFAVAVAPRVFADAHFATLDTFTALGQFAALIALARAVESGGQPRYFALAGFVWGLSLATKFQAMLLGPVGIVWLFWQLGRRACVPIVTWGACGGVTFLALWPWMWYSPFDRLWAYLSTATQRQSLHVYYFGQVWRDIETPWHYPWVMFAVTVPIGLLLLGLLGIAAGGSRWWRDPRLSLIAVAFLFVLAVFSAPRTPVYDGVRLFLVAFPLWAVAAGVGAQWLFSHPRLARFPVQARAAALALFLALQGVGVATYHPIQLSYYNALVGGLSGATYLGFETTYWGDSVTNDLLDMAIEHAAGQAVIYAPHLAPFQASAVEISHPGFAAADVTLLGWDPHRALESQGSRYALVYRRRADLDVVAPLLENAKVVGETTCRGVWLARLYELSTPAESLVPSPDTR